MLRGASMPKLIKMIVSQNTTITSMGWEIELPICSKSSHRRCPRSAALMRLLSDCCKSLA